MCFYVKCMVLGDICPFLAEICSVLGKSHGPKGTQKGPAQTGPKGPRPGPGPNIFICFCQTGTGMEDLYVNRIWITPVAILLLFSEYDMFVCEHYTPLSENSIC